MTHSSNLSKFPSREFISYFSYFTHRVNLNLFIVICPWLTFRSPSFINIYLKSLAQNIFSLFQPFKYFSFSPKNGWKYFEWSPALVKSVGIFFSFNYAFFSKHCLPILIRWKRYNSFYPVSEVLRCKNPKYI